MANKMNKCAHCKQDKQPSEFYKNYPYICRDCSRDYRRRYMRKYRLNNKDRIRKYERGYRKKNRDLLNNRHARWVEENKEQYMEFQRMGQRKYAQRHPEVIKAHNAGSKIKLGNQCEICHSDNCLERHHPDYSLPESIVTVCQGCHRRIHAKN